MNNSHTTDPLFVPPLCDVTESLNASQRALAILQHPASLQFSQTISQTLRRIAYRSEACASSVEWNLIWVCSAALLEAERRPA